MTRKARIGEVVCRCKAYKFPHRLMGGDCTGRRIVYCHWANNESDECRNCSSYYQTEEGNQCDVLDGREETHWCPALQEVLHYHEVPVPKKLKMKRWP